MTASKLDRRVQFLRSTMIDDGWQTRPGPHVPHGDPVWASRADIKDAERFAAGTVTAQLTSRFQVRSTPFTRDITTGDRFTTEGETFGIVGIKQAGGRLQLIEITASRMDQP